MAELSVEQARASRGSRCCRCIRTLTLWGEFFGRIGLRLTGELRAAVYWWSAFRMLRTALWVADGRFHAGLFERAVARVDWVPG